MIIDKRKECRAQTVLHTLFVVMCITAIVPMMLLVTISLTQESYITKHGYTLLLNAENFTTSAYDLVFQTPATIINAYKTTLFIGVVGTVLYLIMATLGAYPLSRPNFRFRKAATWYLLITMLFSGGTAATYVVFSSVYKLRNTYTILIMSGMTNVWYVFMLRAFMQGLPGDMLEAATIDGAGQWMIYWKFVIPMSKACIAVVAFNIFRAYWDQWQPCLYYIDNSEMYTLQYLLQRMLMQIDAIKKQMELGMAVQQSLPSESLRLAMVCLAIGPSILIFPFFQKYFARGLVLGSVKG